MKILALESSAKAASVAICEDGKLISQYWQNSGLTHSRTLMAMTEDILKNLDIKIDSIDVVAVAKGPGSFTGIRIGTAAAKGIAWAAEKPVCGVSTLEAMAYYLIDREDAVICPVMDARRNQVYNAKFEAKDGKLCRLCPDRAVSIQELSEEIKSDGKKYLLIGDGADLCYNSLALFECDMNMVKKAPEYIKLQSAWGVAMAAQDGEKTSPDDLTPNYLRLSQAERERLEREKKEQTQQ